MTLLDETEDKPKRADTLYVTDAELIRRSGLPRDRLYKLLPELEKKYGFPKKSPLFCGRRYWPAVKTWFDKHHAVLAGSEK